MPNPFEVDGIGHANGNDEEEELKEENFKEKMSRLKKVDAKLEFSPKEIIKFYV